MANVNQIPIFVINLKESIHRRQSIERQLTNLKLSYQIFPGFNGRALSDQEAFSLYASKTSPAPFKKKTWYNREINQYTSQPTKAVLGCYVSHANVWKHLIEHNISQAVVMEDDCLIGLQFPQVLQAVAEHLEPVIQYINFYSTVPVRQFGPPLYDLYRLSFPIVPNSSDAASMDGAVAYYITQSMAKKLLDKAFPIRMPVDVYISNFFYDSVGNSWSDPYPLCLFPWIIQTGSLGSVILGDNDSQEQYPSRQQIFNQHSAGILGVLHPPPPPLFKRIKRKLLKLAKKLFDPGR